MKKQTLFIGILFLALSVGLVSAVVYRMTNNKSESEVASEIDDIGNFSPGSQSESYYSDQQKTTGTNDSSLQVYNPDTLNVLGSDQSNNNASLPTPDEFELYEEYADSKEALFTEIRVGDGKEVNLKDNVAIAYKGWLTDGTLFDQSSVDEIGQIQAFSFQVGSGQVITGMDQGIIGMKVGGKRRLVIPASVGYGSEGQRGIPPNSMLIFEIELAAIQ